MIEMYAGQNPNFFNNMNNAYNNMQNQQPQTTPINNQFTNLLLVYELEK